MKRFQFLSVSLALTLAYAPTLALADCVLRQSTASQELALPRFVDSTDGVTAETGLTIANTDIKLTKAGGTTQISKNSGGATHIATGDYYTVLDATDTDTVGNLHIVIGVSGALPVWVDCIVYEEAVYDADFASAATGQRWADVRQFNGSAATASSGRPEVNTTHLAGTTLATLTGPYPALGITESGTAQAATASTFQFRSGAAFANDEPKGWTCGITGGSAGVGQAFTITTYVGSTDTVSALAMGSSTSFTTTPTGTITYVCFGTAAGSSSSVSIAAGGITASSFASGAIDATAIAADAIGASELAASAIGSSELAADAITAAKIATDSISSDEIATTAVTELQSGVATAAALTTVAGYIDTEVASILDDTGSSGVVVASGSKSGYALSATGLDAITFTEPSGKPSWTTSSMVEWLAWLGAPTRNKVTQTSTTKTIRNDADDADIAACTVSDDGTTFTLGECTP